MKPCKQLTGGLAGTRTHLHIAGSEGLDPLIQKYSPRISELLATKSLERTLSGDSGRFAILVAVISRYASNAKDPYLLGDQFDFSKLSDQELKDKVEETVAILTARRLSQNYDTEFSPPQYFTGIPLFNTLGPLLDRKDLRPLLSRVLQTAIKEMIRQNYPSSQYPLRLASKGMLAHTRPDLKGTEAQEYMNSRADSDLKAVTDWLENQPDLAKLSKN